MKVDAVHARLTLYVPSSLNVSFFLESSTPHNFPPHGDWELRAIGFAVIKLRSKSEVKVVIPSMIAYASLSVLCEKEGV